MRAFKTIFKLTGLILTLTFSIDLLMAQETINIVPNPQEVIFTEGSFSLEGDIGISLYLNNKDEEAFIFEQLKNEFNQSIGSGIKVQEGGGTRRIIIGVEGGSRAFNRLINQFDLKPGEELGKEGYRLLVTPELILISANSIKGAFYGAQTMKQLIRTERFDLAIPALQIKDWPDLEIRGMMDDISRGPVPTKEYMYQQIERMAEMKVNLLTYYTQDVVKTESHPAFAPPGGALDIQEWAELADYAKKYHIDLVGNFQSFGHFENILKHPEYAHLGEGGALLSPAFEESYQLLEDIYREMIPAFHSDYFHINSDETFDLGTGASKAMVDSLGEAVVYSNHIIRIYEIITGMGKKVMMWGDIALEQPKILELLPKDIILVTWGYDIMDDYAPRIIPFKEAGFTQLVSTGVLNSSSTIPDFNIAKGNIGGFMAESKKQNVWGMLNTVWDDGGFALFSRDWYGVAFAADQSWNSNPEDPTYDTRFNRAVYGSTNNGITEALSKINELADLKSTEKMNEAVLWGPLVPEKGEEVLTNISDWVEVKKITGEAEKLLEKADPLIYSQDMEFIRHTIDLYEYLASSRPNLVKASELYAQAITIQNENPVKTRELLVDIYGVVTETYEDLSELKIRNQFLWISENRVYALDRVVSRYDDQIESLKGLKELILDTIFDFDKGIELPRPEDARLNITATDGWYFQGWLMIEPIPNTGGYSDPGIDHLEDMNGIEGTFPNVTEEFYFDGTKYRWRRVNTPYFAKVDLDEIHGESKNVVAYSFAHIDIHEDRVVRATLGSSDGVEVFLNGESVHQNYTERDFKLDEDELYLPLKAGRNHLMIRITNKEGDWAFSFRLPDSEMRSSKNRYKIIE